MYLLSRTGPHTRRLLDASLISLACLFGPVAPALAYDCPIDVGAVFNQYGGYYNGPVLPNPAAFAAIQSNGSIEAWGHESSGGTGEPTGTGYVSVVGNWFAFAALKNDGSISSWGVDSAGGGTDSPQGVGFQSISSNVRAFAALHADGSISSWGDLRYGGGDSPAGNDFTYITGNGGAFAALDTSGAIHTWGENESGAQGGPTDDGYIAVGGSLNAFAAMKEDGSISTWGAASSVGSGAPNGTGFYRIYSTTRAFAALHEDGRIESWGNPAGGGQGAPSSGRYTSIATTDSAFAAIREDGAIYAWGANTDGGTAAPTESGFVSIVGTQHAFAALHEDGRILTWGDLGSGGFGAPSDNGYEYIVSNHDNFAALKNDGTIYTWGGESTLGTVGIEGEVYVDIASTGGAFAALNADGSVETWGFEDSGGSGGPIGSNTASIFGRSSNSTNQLCVPGREVSPYIDGIATAEAFVGEEYTFRPQVFDADGGPYTLRVDNAPSWLGINVERGEVSGVPSESDVGAANGIVISVTDSQGLRAELAPINILVQDTREQTLVADLIEPESFFVQNLEANGIENVVAEYMGDYEAAFEQLDQPLATLTELQDVINEVNDRLDALFTEVVTPVVEIEAPPTEIEITDTETPDEDVLDNEVPSEVETDNEGESGRETETDTDTEVERENEGESELNILSVLTESDVNNGVAENAEAYIAALEGIDSDNIESEQLQQIIEEVNNIEALLSITDLQSVGSEPEANLVEVLEPFNGINQEFLPELVGNLLELEIRPTDAEVVNELIEEITERAEFQPVVYLVLEQGGRAVRSISPTNGLVTLSARIDNLDDPESISYDWNDSTARIVSASVSETLDDQVMQFDPTDLRSQDRLIARVTATHRELSSTSKLVIVVNDGITNIADVIDSDNDGITDQFEGSLDASDSNENENKLQGRAGEDSSFVLETETGLKLRMGTDSRVANTQQGGLSFNELLSVQPTADVDSREFENPDKVYDFEIAGLSRVGDSVHIVLPHQTRFPEGAVYGKFHPATGWVEFVEDSANSISSSDGIDGIIGQCPAPGSPSYEPGIQAGHSCLQLWIQDGGPNDSDRLDENGQVRADSGLNGVVEDPGAILTPRAVEPVVEAVPNPVEAPETDSESVVVTESESVEGPNTDTLPNGPFTPVIAAAEESEPVAMAATGGSSGGAFTPWMLLVLGFGFGLKLFRRSSYVASR